MFKSVKKSEAPHLGEPLKMLAGLVLPQQAQSLVPLYWSDCDINMLILT